MPEHVLSNLLGISITLHKDDLPPEYDPGDIVAIDTETTGLSLTRDRLCLVQLAGRDKQVHLVKMSNKISAPNLSAIITSSKIMKLFHFGRFDIAVLYKNLGVLCNSVYCTKIASKLARTYTDYHGLKELCKELLGVELSKVQQSSDWGTDNLSEAQINYAARDVIYLHELMGRLNIMLKREGRYDLAQSCFQFLPTRAMLDLSNFDEPDLFTH